MRETRRCFCNFSYYDQQAIRETLEDMAARGRMLEKTGSFWWTYRRMEPQKLRFSVTDFPDVSEFDPGLTEGELTKLDYCRQDGWEFVARWDEVRKNYVFIDHYEPADPAPWGADEAYQRHWSEGVLNDYLLFWGDRIVELKFYWEPTPEQIAAAAEKLKGSFADGAVSR